MARPLKKGLDYFPFDVGFFGPESTEVKILKSRYHSDGIAVYLYILCTIYSNGYYYVVDNWEDFIFVVADEFSISVDKVEQIITFLCNRSMLHKFEVKDCIGDAVLTSHGIQKRYVEAKKNSKKHIADIKGEYWLLSEKEEAELDTFYKSTISDDNSENNPNNSENNPNNSEINPLNKSKVNITSNEVIKVSKKETKKGNIDSYDDIFADMEVNDRVKRALLDFIRHLQINGVKMINSRLENIITKLDLVYGVDELAKCQEVRRAIVNGYKRLPCEGAD
jgi:hypothetical protein